MPRFHIGTAGWPLPRHHRDRFPIGASNLARYAAHLNAAEINTSFYRSHKHSIYARWAAAVPKGFRFAVKVPKAITHDQRLERPGPLLDAFLDECGTLGSKLGPLLVQLPGKQPLVLRTVRIFFRVLRKRFDGPVVCEPRNPAWFTPEIETMLKDYGVSRVAADPARVPEAAEPGGDPSIAYFRWHGSPNIYISNYDDDRLTALAAKMRKLKARDVWCIFDNTMSGSATGNALRLRELLGRGQRDDVPF
ncbi:MAG: DUF72 domain-containing protein [Alphaproteobacteria bacterium]|nr:DUF72 domain-containing protein [Alphaproteobacteria bacterium]